MIRRRLTFAQVKRDIAAAHAAIRAAIAELEGT
jgi:hypothetical protein